jgi:multiple sugar transport system permease protein
MGPLLYLNGQPDLYPLQMALALYRSIYGGEPAMLAALTIVALVPLIIIYLCMQKFFIEGIATSGIKG